MHRCVSTCGAHRHTLSHILTWMCVTSRHSRQHLAFSSDVKQMIWVKSFWWHAPTRFQSWIFHRVVHCFPSQPFCSALVICLLWLSTKGTETIPGSRKQTPDTHRRWSEQPPDNHTPYSFFSPHSPEWLGEHFRTQPLIPIKEVTIETGQWACDRPNSETVRTVWNPIAVLASIYKVIHSFWQRLLSRRTPHFHDNQQKHPAAEDKVIQPGSRTLTEKPTQTASDYTKMTNTRSVMSALSAVSCLIPIRPPQ